MSSGTVSIAAATAIINYDLFVGARFKHMADRHRKLTGIKVTGSAAAGDTELELFVGTSYIGNFFNTATGFGNADDVQDADALIQAGEELFCIVKDAPTTNPINVQLIWNE